MLSGFLRTLLFLTKSQELAHKYDISVLGAEILPPQWSPKPIVFKTQENTNGSCAGQYYSKFHVCRQVGVLDDEFDVLVRQLGDAHRGLVGVRHGRPPMPPC